MASPAYGASTGWEKAAASLQAIVAAFLRKPYKDRLIAAAGRFRRTSEAVSASVAGFLSTAIADYRSGALTRRLRETSEALAATIADYCHASSKTRLAAVVLVAIGSSALGFLATSALLQRPPATVAASETLPPPSPKLSWVTAFEIEHAQKLGRVLLDVSPADLLSMYEHKGSDAVDTYRDGWVKIDYPLVSVERQRFDKTSYDVVETAAHFQSVFPGKVIAVFNAQKWHARLLMHRVGDQIVAFCKFKEIEREEVLTNIHRLWFYGIGCDLPQL